MEFSLLLSPPLHSLPTLTLQPIQLWLEKPLSFQSLQSFDHNEFQSLPPPTLCSHLYWRSYKEESAEWRDKECKAVIESVFSERIIHTELSLRKIWFWKEKYIEIISNIVYQKIVKTLKIQYFKDVSTVYAFGEKKLVKKSEWSQNTVTAKQENNWCTLNGRKRMRIVWIWKKSTIT